MEFESVCSASSAQHKARVLVNLCTLFDMKFTLEKEF